MLGVGPGSLIEWVEENDQVVVRRCGRYSCVDIHNVLFPNAAVQPTGSADVRQTIRKAVRLRKARY